MDDEKYFSFTNDSMPQNSGFYTDNARSCPSNVKYKGKNKFPKKILVWIAISEHGLSEPSIRFSTSCSINHQRRMLSQKIVAVYKEISWR